MSTGRNCLVFGMLVGTALLGCSSTPAFNYEFGKSVRANLSAQTLDPAASANTSPATGMDGHAAQAVQERYQRSFKEATPGSNQGMISTSAQ
jgi:type IV pilus biogenesis protein CpaD/CtpE